MDKSSFSPLRITSAAIVPGIHPHDESSITIITDPQPLSITARGGNSIHKSTLKQDICKKYMFCAKVVNKLR